MFPDSMGYLPPFAQFAALFSLEIFVQVSENGIATTQPDLVVLVSHSNSGNQPLDSKGLLTLKLRVLEIDVMYDFCYWSKGGIIHCCALDQNFQSAVVALVREFRLEHIEAQLAV